MKKNIVAIGHGYWGKNIVRNLHALGVLYGVCEVNETARQQVAQLYPDIRIFESPEQVLFLPEVEAVAISTPAETHAQLSIHTLST